MACFVSSSPLWSLLPILVRHLIQVCLESFDQCFAGSLLGYADAVIVLDQGAVVDTGSLTSLQSNNPYVQDLKETGTMFLRTKGSEETLQITEDSSSRTVDVDLEDRGSLQDQSLTDHSRQAGDFSIYAYYISASGRISVIFFFLTVLCWSFCREFSSKSQEFVYYDEIYMPDNLLQQSGWICGPRPMQKVPTPRWECTWGFILCWA